MPKQNEAKKLVKSTKLTEGEKKKLKQENKAKANPEKAAAKKVKSDAKRERRYVRVLSDFYWFLSVLVPLLFAGCCARDEWVD